MSSRIAPSSPKTASPVAKPTNQSNVASQSSPSLPRERVAARAYEKWCQRGRIHGNDHRDWVEAERELSAELAKAKR